MPRVDFPIVGDYNIGRGYQYDTQDTLNMYIDNDPDAIHKTQLVQLPGTLEYFEMPTGAICRENGLYAYKTDLYAVFGSIFYTIDKNLNIQSFPVNLASSTGPLSWANSTNEVAVCDGLKLYVYNIPGNSFAEVTSIQTADFPASPFAVYYQDARLFVRFRNDPRVYWSAQGDFTSFNSLNFVIQQSRPSLAQGIVGINERLILLGDASNEIWAPPTYNSDVPIIRDNNLIYEFGCEAPYSVVKGVMERKQGEELISFVSWLSKTNIGKGVFVLSTGGAPVNITSPSVSRLLETFSRLDDCVSIVYKEAGTVFIENTFKEENKTLIYNVNNGTWTRKNYLTDNSRSSINAHAFFNGRHVCGSRFNSKIYELTKNCYTDQDEHVLRSRTSFILEDPNHRRIEGNEFRVICQTGFVDVGDGFNNNDVDPIMFLSYSQDGGVTYSNPEPFSLGKIGNYKQQALWFTFGIAYQFNFKIDVYSPFPLFIRSASFDYEVLNS